MKTGRLLLLFLTLLLVILGFHFGLLRVREAGGNFVAVEGLLRVA
jgi:hypothetical protein